MTVDARGRERVQTHFPDESQTIQSDRPPSITEMLKDFGVLRMTNMLDETELVFADVSEFTDFADVMNHVKEAERTFLKLPPQVRARFDHDVRTWLDSAHAERRERRTPPPREERSREGDPDPAVVVAPVTVVDPVEAPKGA